VEGTGSYGAGLTRALRLEGIDVVEVTRTARVGGRHRGKNDTRDAEAAARNVLSGQATAIPISRDGIVESIRVLRNTRASAVKARTQAILHLKNLVLTAPDELREALRDLSTKQLLARCARMHRSDRLDALHATRHALRTLARRSRAQRRDPRARRPPRRSDREGRAAPAARARDRSRDRRAPAARRRRQPDPAAQRRRPRRALRRQPDRSVKWQDHPSSPQPRRRSPN
jgi:hypothetical protein